MNHFSNSFKSLVLLTATAALLACGGGGDSGGGSSSGGSTAPAVTPSLSVTDLDIAAENNLESVYEVDVNVDISAISTEKAFISICDNGTAKGDLTKLDFNMCLLKSSLVDGKGEFDLRVANHCDELIAVIWIMEKDRAPLTYTLTHNNQKQTYWDIN
ncbi:hypothetical protein RJD38_02140 [Vibrio scophthalmi]|uniref:Uncharacterized protein n=1 Tax=Vibrio scophthalmi TaxID=45658 RepID=A0A1B1NQR9_9VIBR|nr:hypothetical protein [Vibrio scophthalmi]ANS86046.1 hypothetical protein VSVS12_02285 [Vibrio scophthalmi]ANU35821.1 hypothetical protein VSVS05_00689 [Vibrio scophthalmi]